MYLLAPVLKRQHVCRLDGLLHDDRLISHGHIVGLRLGSPRQRQQGVAGGHGLLARKGFKAVLVALHVLHSTRADGVGSGVTVSAQASAHFDVFHQHTKTAQSRQSCIHALHTMT